MEKEKRKELVEALNDIKFSLYSSKLKSPKIKRSEFKKIVDSAKFRFNKVIDAIDDCFREYFPPKISFYEKENVQTNEENNSGPTNSGPTKGPTLVKRNGNHFISKDETNSQAA